MGGAVSTGQNNDDLIDNLLRADYIRTPTVEKVFRAVDRADYFLPDARQNAYKDVAWKLGHLHLSAPCIYSEVMEGLRLEPGLSFLNLGSGTGYLSTMAGLILGSHGINHGVEIHEDVIVYANKKLEDFKKFSGAIDEFDFCEPKFIQGNCLCLANGRQYDRVYCGASCPEQYEGYMKSLLRIGGILIMPLNDHLMEIRRVSEVEWVDHTLIPVSFATLILPPEGNQDIVELLEVSPSTLQFLTRTAIRSILRHNIEIENPGLKEPKPKPTVKKHKRRDRTLKKLIVPIFDETDEDLYSSGDDQYSSDDGRCRHHSHSSNEFRPRTADNIIDIVMDHLGYRVRRVNRHQNQDERSGEDRNAEDSSEVSEEIGLRVADSDNVVSSEVDEDLEHVFESKEEDDPTAHNIDNKDILNDQPETSSNTSGDSPKCENVLESERQLETENDKDEEEENYNIAGTSSGKKPPREKYDSGYVEEMEQEIPTKSDKPDPMDLSDPDSMGVASSSSSEDRQGRRHKRCYRFYPDAHTGPKSRKIVPAMLLDNSSGSSCLSSDSEVAEEKSTPPTAVSLTVASLYTPYMRQKLQELPLPSVLKNYLNYYREF